MRTLTARVSGQEVVINVVETNQDLDQFRQFIKFNSTLAFDTETTGLDIYSNNFKVRLAQFGNDREAYVLPVERSARAVYFAAEALRRLDKIIIHKAAFDLEVADRHWGVALEETFPKCVDTKILAHLVDSRARAEGGTGHSLEELTAAHIDAETAEDVKGSMKAMAKNLRCSMGDVFASVSSRDETYLRYSGMDPILTYRLHRKLLPLVPSESRRLIRYEHEVARVCSTMARTGLLLDAEYTRKAAGKLKAKETRETKKAAKLGVENVFANVEVIEALKHYGWTQFGATDSGAESVSKGTLEAAMQSDSPEVAGLAEAVSEAKKAHKWRTTWLETFLATADAEGRCHPSINALQARTGRMSITGIPAQTLPAGDSMIRRAFLADPSQVILSTDYSGQELRVMAALSGDNRMRKAFAEGEDLHQITADAAGVERKAGKGTNFAVLFGGGWEAVYKQFGVPVEQAMRAIDAFWSTYPGVKKFAADCTAGMRRNGYVTTPTGRRIWGEPPSRMRPYRGTSYVIQSTGRDVTCEGLLRMDKAGLTPYMRLPIHDEVLFSVPEDRAEDAAQMTSRLMATTLKGVDLTTDAEIGGRSWGSLYEE